MKAKSLETLLANQSGFYSDMVTRFQGLRGFSLISNARGRNAEYLTPNEVVAGIFAVVAERPGFAATTAQGLLKMKPVGLPEDAFGGAPSLGEAVAKSLLDEDLRGTLVEIRLGDSDPRGRNSTTAAIVYKSGSETLTSFYIGATAVSQFVKGKEKTFDRNEMGEFSIKRETVITSRLINRVAREMKRSDEYRDLGSVPARG